MNNYEYEKLTPFKWFVLQNFPFIDTDFDAITNWQLFCKLGEEINKLIDSQNNVGQEMENISIAFNNLYDYVNQYFDNLDVQEEINNKLDDMAESGELQNIITNYLGNSYIIEDIIFEKHYNAEHNTNYYITRVPNKDNKGNKIKLKHGFANDNETAQCKADETTSNFAKRHNATLCVNASIFQNSNPQYENYNHIMGLIINDGHVISNYNFDGIDDISHYSLLGVKEDNTLVVYPHGTSSTDILADGCYTTFSAFEKRMENGVLLTNSEELYQWNLIGQNTETKEIVFICCDGKNINNAQGMSQVELLNILKNEYNCDFAYRLDCGGSTTMVVNSVVKNQITDNLGQKERLVPDYIYFSKEIETIFDKNISTSNNNIGDATEIAKNSYQSSVYLNNTETNRIFFDSPNPVYQATGINLIYRKNGVQKVGLIVSPDNVPDTINLFDYENNETLIRFTKMGDIITKAGELAKIFKVGKTIDDLNTVYETNIVRCSQSTLNSPDDRYQWLILSLRVEMAGCIQIAIPLRQNQTLTPWKVRHRTDNDIGGWYTLLQPTN